jgi:hypothetical protein
MEKENSRFLLDNVITDFEKLNIKTMNNNWFTLSDATKSET